MAWNGSGGSATPPKKAKVSGTGSSSLFRGIAALLLVLVIGGVAYLFVTQELPKVNEPTEEKVEKKAIEVVEPEIAERVEVEEVKVEKPKRPLKFWEVDESQTNGFTLAQQRKWRDAHRAPPAYTNDMALTRAKAPFAIFNHPSENEIACLLMTEPGRTMIGNPTYRGFTEDFLKSCEEPILVSKDDDEYTANLKRMMNETKIELRQRIAEGERLEDILKETREEMQRLSQYKSMVDATMREFARDGQNSDADVEDFLSAANKMLEDKGIAPLTPGVITRMRLRNLMEKGNPQ